MIFSHCAWSANYPIHQKVLANIELNATLETSVTLQWLPLGVFLTSNSEATNPCFNKAFFRSELFWILSLRFWRWKLLTRCSDIGSTPSSPRVNRTICCGGCGGCCVCAGCGCECCGCGSCGSFGCGSCKWKVPPTYRSPSSQTALSNTNLKSESNCCIADKWFKSEPACLTMFELCRVCNLMVQSRGCNFPVMETEEFELSTASPTRT